VCCGIEKSREEGVTTRPLSYVSKVLGFAPRMPFRFFFVTPEPGFNTKINGREKRLVRI
jgi:hypothetical protein